MKAPLKLVLSSIAALVAGCAEYPKEPAAQAPPPAAAPPKTYATVQSSASSTTTTTRTQAAPAPAPAPPATSTAPASGAPATTGAPPPSAPAQLSTNELEKLVMPIALHPDPLIAIILPASVYPLEIVQAARFVRDTNNISKVDAQDWDTNVKALAKFPDMIAKMDGDLDWTMKLGQAFLDQPKELMDTIQNLRAKAQKAGTLRTTDQQIVSVTNVVILETNSCRSCPPTRKSSMCRPIRRRSIIRRRLTFITRTRHWSLLELG
jgi:hypothetical protein